MYNNLCHCGLSKPFSHCCKPIIESQLRAPCAESLMRARFSAFKLQAHHFLIQTNLPKNSNERLTAGDFDTSLTWLGLWVQGVNKVNKVNKKTLTAQVEFVAFYQDQSKKIFQLHERSNFVKQQDEWFYTNGQELPDIKIPRNHRCFCLSGKKFKACHGLAS